MTTMTSKERVLRTLRRGAADRVPINYSANPGIDGRLKEHFGLAPGDWEGLRRALGVDFRPVYVPYRGPALHAPSDRPDLRIDPDWGFQSRYIEHSSGGYWEPWGEPLRDADLAAALAWPMPSPDDYDTAHLRAQCEQFKDYAVFIHASFEVMNWTGRFFGHERMYLGLQTEDEAVLAFINRFVAVKYEVLTRALEAAGDAIDFLWIGEDLGTQRGPRIGLDLFRERIRPIHQPFIDLAKGRDLPVLIHSCGSSSWAFEDMIEMGIDAVDTLQPEAANMAPEHLKKTFGGRLAFHGCISTAGPVSFGTVGETIDHCRATLDVMKPGGGYCFAPTHMLQDNSPTENVVAMYDVAREYGIYY